jgi:hypothetical protein
VAIKKVAGFGVVQVLLHMALQQKKMVLSQAATVLVHQQPSGFGLFWPCHHSPRKVKRSIVSRCS